MRNSKFVQLHAGRDKSVRRHHPWIFTGAIEHIGGQLRMGDTVDVIDADGTWLAKGAYSPHSQIAVRIWSYTSDEVIDNAFFMRKLSEAKTRKLTLLQRFDTNAYRLVAAEADGLPGVTIDVYDNVVVMQLLSAGADKHRKKLLWALSKLYPNAIIHERSDVDVRKKEGLEPLVQTLQGELPPQVVIRENGLLIEVDLLHGHKTGFYLDQRENRMQLAQYCDNKDLLNCFSYTGTFGLYAAKHGAKSVINIDASQVALDKSERILQLNNIDSNVSHIQGDVFELLRRYLDDGKRFDVIVLDPPKFVDSKHHLTRAARGYKDINRLAMMLLRPNGILATFSCSGLMSAELFQKVVSDAALDAHREAYIVQRLSQSCDHPSKTNFPESHYLKGLICVVS